MKRWMVLVPVVALVALACGCGVPLAKKSEIVVQPTSGDSYAAFKKAIDDVKDGGTIRLKTGTYKLSSSLQILKSVKIVGDGADKTHVVGASGDAVVELNGNATVSVESVGFERSGQQGGDVVDVVAATATFTSCSFSGAKAGNTAGGLGLAFFLKSKGTVKDCTVSDNERSGIHAQDQAQVELSGNTSTKNLDAGIAFVGQASGSATGNTCTHNDFDGIHIQDKCAPELTKNTCTNNRQGGIVYIGKAAGTASGNTCTDNGGPGISVGETATPDLLNNTCKKNPYGIAYYDSAGGTAESNNCPSVRTGDIGIAVYDKADPKLIDNKTSVILKP
jgi:parallel beta-helix repeat protein